MTEESIPTTRPWRPGDTPPEVRARIERKQAELDALREKRERDGVEPAERPRRGSRTSSSVMFTVRLPHGDFEALERQAARRGIKPSMLARNLLRHGLSYTSSFDMSDLVDEMAVLVERMRIVAP